MHIVPAFVLVVNTFSRIFSVRVARGPPYLVERFRVGGSHQGESPSPPGSSKAGMVIPALASKLHFEFGIPKVAGKSLQDYRLTVEVVNSTLVRRHHD